MESRQPSIQKQLARIEQLIKQLAVEEDVDKNVHFAVVLEDDPGRDIGMMRYIAHRFFYSADEVEPI